MIYVDLNLRNMSVKKTDRKSFGQKGIDICREVSKGKSERIVVLKNKKKTTDIHNKQLFLPCNSIR
jgi:hypothetical protein